MPGPETDSHPRSGVDSAASVPAACGQCGAAPGSTLACLACGAVPERSADASPFEDLGQPRSVALDSAALEAAYLRLSRRLHPDFHGGGDAALQDRVSRHSAHLNEAWLLLSEPATRAECLLELLAPGALAAARTLDPAFLMEAMELSEAVEDARGKPPELAALRRRVQAQADARLAQILDPARWQPPQPQGLAVLLHELRTCQRILHDIEQSE